MFSGEEQSYSKDILERQLNMGGVRLTSEVKDNCWKLDLPNACLKYVHRKQVFDLARLSNLKKLKEDMEGMSKMKDVKKEDLCSRHRHRIT